MFGRLATKLTKSLLRYSRLSTSDRASLAAELLDKLAVLPIHDIIVFSEDGSIFVNGKRLTIEESVQFRESAHDLVNNVAFKLIHTHTERVAITQGVHKAESDIQLLFGRAAIWFSQQEMIMANKLAQYPILNIEEEN